MKITGFSFKKTNDGEVVGVSGKEIIPHRLDLIKSAINAGKNNNDIDNMFFNFDLPDCENGTTLEQMHEEAELYRNWKSNLHMRMLDSA
jgi:hypothetical protein